MAKSNIPKHRTRRKSPWRMVPLLLALGACNGSEPGLPGMAYVGRVGAGQPCGDFGSWHGSRVGEEGLLRQICEYTWSGAEPPDLTALPDGEDGVEGLSASSPRVIPLADAFSTRPAIRKALFSAVMARIGRVPVTPGETPAFLYIIDTIPESLMTSGASPTSRHGLTLRELIENILCESGRCSARVASILGLPRVTPEAIDLEHGGSYGSLVDLARGINAAIDDWDLNGSDSRLVLLLAVGWEPREERDVVEAGEMSLLELLAPGNAGVDLQAVLGALTRASCRGALVVAASGNASGEPCEQAGAMGPGFLQSLRTPSAVECSQIGFKTAPLYPSVSTPLVLSATQVGLDGGPLANARPGTSALVSAQGSMFGSMTGDSELLIGSSVASTVVAATVSAVWSSFPELSRAQMFEVVQREAAAPTGLTRGPHEVTLCTALAVACEASGGAGCTALPGCPESSDVVVQVADQFAMALLPRPCEAEDGGCNDPREFVLGTNFPASTSTNVHACGAPTNLWPSVEVPATMVGPENDWAEPQPKETYCPTCIAQLTAKPEQITVGLAFRAQIPTPYPLMIEVETSSGVERYAVDTDRIDWGPQGVNLVHIQPAKRWASVQKIRLSYYLSDSSDGWRLVSEPLLRADIATSDGGPALDGLCACVGGEEVQLVCGLPLGLGESDPDHDGVGLLCDNAPSMANPDQTDTDVDGFGDIVDLCPTLPSGSNLGDADRDGIGDPCDRCRRTREDYNVNAELANAPAHMWVRNIPRQEDFDQDGIGDVCDNCIVRANCGGFGPAAEGLSPAGIGDPVPFDDPAVCQVDSNPFIGDPCIPNGVPLLLDGAAGPVGLGNDDDFDQDGLPNLTDKCPRQPVLAQACAGDEDCPQSADCTGSVCNHSDSDNDGLGDLCDTCPVHSNPNQVQDGGLQNDDPDQDFVGSLCETHDECHDRADARRVAFYTKVADGQCCVQVFSESLGMTDPGRAEIDEVTKMCEVIDPTVPLTVDCPPDQEGTSCRRLPEVVLARPGVVNLPQGCFEAGTPLTLDSPEIAGDDEKLYSFLCLMPQADQDFDGIGDRCDLCPFAFDPNNEPHKEGGQVWPHLGKFCSGSYAPEKSPSTCEDP